MESGALAEAIRVPLGVTALVGGGGKTTLMLRLAGELAGRGKRVIVATTTHIWPPEHMPVLLDPSEREVREALDADSPIAVGTLAPDGKLSPWNISPEQLCSLADYVLMEADGSKRLPLKAPAAHEPVIPACAGLVLAVAGLDGVGAPMQETVFRPELYGLLLGETDLSRAVTTEDVGRVLTHPEGQRKGVPKGARFAVVLNKADDQARRAMAEEIAERISQAQAEAVYSVCLKGRRIEC